MVRTERLPPEDFCFEAAQVCSARKRILCQLLGILHDICVMCAKELQCNIREVSGSVVCENEVNGWNGNTLVTVCLYSPSPRDGLFSPAADGRTGISVLRNSE